jgi:hypothetical protein
MLQELSHMDRITQLQDEIQQVSCLFHPTKVDAQRATASDHHVK